MYLHLGASDLTPLQHWYMLIKWQGTVSKEWSKHLDPGESLRTITACYCLSTSLLPWTLGDHHSNDDILSSVLCYCYNPTVRQRDKIYKYPACIHLPEFNI